MKKLVCKFRGHTFAGWSKVTRNIHGPLPMAHCSRCGTEL